MSMVRIESINASTRVITTQESHGFETGYVIGLVSDPASEIPALDAMYYARAITSTTLTLHVSAGDAQSGASPVELPPTAALHMSLERLSIKERLERGILHELADIPDVIHAQRSSIDNERLGDRVVVLIADDEQAIVNSWPYVDMEVTYLAQAHLHPRSDDSTPHATLANRWLAAIQQAVAQVLCGSRFGVAGNVIKIEIAGTQWDLSGDLSELVCGVEFLVVYRHRTDDPFSEN